MDSTSRNGHSSGSERPGAVVPATGYETAIAVATSEEKERLQAMRLRFDIPPDSPEWIFYAVMAPLMGSASKGAAKAAGDLTEHVALLEPTAAAVKEMASDLSRLRASVSRGKAPGYWTLYAMVCLGLVLGLVVAGLAEHFGLQGNRQYFVTEGGIAVLSWSAVALAVFGAGVTWLLSRP